MHFSLYTDIYLDILSNTMTFRHFYVKIKLPYI